jgi:PTS system mannitol-specific IIC component
MPQSISTTQINTIIFACEAGMGSSLMSVNSLKKKLKAAQITNVTILHKPARDIPADAQVVVVHKGLAKVARTKAPSAVILAFNHFLNDPIFDRLVKAFVEKTEIADTEV